MRCGKIREFHLRTRKLLTSNADAVQAHNTAFFNRFLWIGLLLAVFAACCGLVRTDMRHALGAYLAVAAGFAVLMAVFRSKWGRRHPLLGLYLLITLFFALALYLSCVSFRTRYVATALTFFCVAPLLFVDRPERVTLYTAALYLVHTGAVFAVKDPVVAGVDAINTLISLLLGVSIARLMIRDRLECFEASRLLKQERETDALTTLSNRRKLFDTMAAIESGGETPPDGVLMMDIDHFKQFNDSFGHAAGDECLRRFGTMLHDFEPVYQIRFYRYGGEEFVALVRNCDLAELTHIAEAVRIAAQKRDMGARSITVSIGAAICSLTENANMEYWINKADEAAYRAKSNGRNCVECS